MTLDEKVERLQMNRIRNMFRATFDVLGAMSIYLLESVREDALHPNKGAGHMLRGGRVPDPEPWLTPNNTDPAVYNTLNHSGDVLDGFYLASLTYWALSVPQLKLSERTKLAGASVFSIGFVSLYELGISHSQKPDPWDIPAGVVGTSLYALANVLIRRYM